MDASSRHQRSSLGLEVARPIPISFSPTFGTSLLLPQDVGTLTNMLIMSTVPMIFRAPLWAPFLFPKGMCPFTHRLFQAEPRL